jgi:hypothetical protein
MRLSTWEISHTVARRDAVCVCSSVSLRMFTLARPHVKPLSAVKITATGATPGEGASKIGNVGLEAVWQKNSS